MRTITFAAFAFILPLTPAFAADFTAVNQTIEKNLGVSLSGRASVVTGGQGYCTISVSLEGGIPQVRVQTFDAMMRPEGLGVFPDGPTDRCTFKDLGVSNQTVTVVHCYGDGVKDLVVGQDYFKLEGYVCEFGPGYRR